MSSHKPYRARTIRMSNARSEQVAMAAAELDITGEEFISSCILAGLLSLASRDKTLGLCFARAAGLSFDQLKLLATSPTVAKLLGS